MAASNILSSAFGRHTASPGFGLSNACQCRTSIRVPLHARTSSKEDAASTSRPSDDVGDSASHPSRSRESRPISRPAKTFPLSPSSPGSFVDSRNLAAVVAINASGKRRLPQSPPVETDIADRQEVSDLRLDNTDVSSLVGPAGTSSAGGSARPNPNSSPLRSDRPPTSIHSKPHPNFSSGPSPGSVTRAIAGISRSNAAHGVRVPTTVISGFVDTACSRSLALELTTQLDPRPKKQQLGAHTSNGFLAHGLPVGVSQAVLRAAELRELDCKIDLDGQGFVDLSAYSRTEKGAEGHDRGTAGGRAGAQAVDLCKPDAAAWSDVLERLLAVPRGQPAYCRQVNLDGYICGVPVVGQIDFLLLLWGDNDRGDAATAVRPAEGSLRAASPAAADAQGGSSAPAALHPRFRIIECKNTSAARTSQRTQATVYLMLLRQRLADPDLRLLEQQQRAEQPTGAGRWHPQHQHQCEQPFIDSPQQPPERPHPCAGAMAGTDRASAGSTGPDKGPWATGRGGWSLSEVDPARCDCAVVRNTEDGRPVRPLGVAPLDAAKLQEEVERLMSSRVAPLVAAAREAVGPDGSADAAARLVDSQRYCIAYSKCTMCNHAPFCFADSVARARTELLELNDADSAKLREAGLNTLWQVAALDLQGDTAARLRARGFSCDLSSIQVKAQAYLGGTLRNARPPTPGTQIAASGKSYTPSVIRLTAPGPSSLPEWEPTPPVELATRDSAGPRSSRFDSSAASRVPWGSRPVAAGAAGAAGASSLHPPADGGTRGPREQGGARRPGLLVRVFLTGHPDNTASRFNSLAAHVTCAGVDLGTWEPGSGDRLPGEPDDWTQVPRDPRDSRNVLAINRFDYRRNAYDRNRELDRLFLEDFFRELVQAIEEVSGLLYRTVSGGGPGESGESEEPWSPRPQPVHFYMPSRRLLKELVDICKWCGALSGASPLLASVLELLGYRRGAEQHMVSFLDSELERQVAVGGVSGNMWQLAEHWWKSPRFTYAPLKTVSRFRAFKPLVDGNRKNLARNFGLTTIEKILRSRTTGRLLAPGEDKRDCEELWCEVGPSSGLVDAEFFDKYRQLAPSPEAARGRDVAAHLPDLIGQEPWLLRFLTERLRTAHRSELPKPPLDLGSLLRRASPSAPSGVAAGAAASAAAAAQRDGSRPAAGRGIADRGAAVYRGSAGRKPLANILSDLNCIEFNLQVEELQAELLQVTPQERHQRGKSCLVSDVRPVLETDLADPWVRRAVRAVLGSDGGSSGAASTSGDGSGSGARAVDGKALKDLRVCCIDAPGRPGGSGSGWGGHGALRPEYGAGRRADEEQQQQQHPLAVREGDFVRVHVRNADPRQHQTLKHVSVSAGLTAVVEAVEPLSSSLAGDEATGSSGDAGQPDRPPQRRRQPRLILRTVWAGRKKGGVANGSRDGDSVRADRSGGGGGGGAGGGDVRDDGGGSSFVLPNSSSLLGSELVPYATLDDSMSDFVKNSVNRRLRDLEPEKLRWLDQYILEGGLEAQRGPFPEAEAAVARLAADLQERQQVLGPEQAALVASGLSAACQLVQGPPGTGKTQLLAAAVLLRLLLSSATRPALGPALSARQRPSPPPPRRPSPPVFPPAPSAFSARLPGRGPKPPAALQSVAGDEVSSKRASGRSTGKSGIGRVALLVTTTHTAADQALERMAAMAPLVRRAAAATGYPHTLPSFSFARFTSSARRSRGAVGSAGTAPSPNRAALFDSSGVDEAYGGSGSSSSSSGSTDSGDLFSDARRHPLAPENEGAAAMAAMASTYDSENDTLPYASFEGPAAPSDEVQGWAVAGQVDPAAACPDPIHHIHVGQEGGFIRPLDGLRADGGVLVVGCTVSAALKLASYLKADAAAPAGGPADPWVSCPLDLLALDETSMMTSVDLLALLSLFQRSDGDGGDGCEGSQRDQGQTPAQVQAWPGQQQLAGKRLGGGTQAQAGQDWPAKVESRRGQGQDQGHPLGGRQFSGEAPSRAAQCHVAVVAVGDPQQLQPIKKVDARAETRPDLSRRPELAASAYDLLAAVPGPLRGALSVTHRFGPVTALLLSSTVYHRDNIQLTSAAAASAADAAYGARQEAPRAGSAGAVVAARVRDAGGAPEAANIEPSVEAPEAVFGRLWSHLGEEELFLVVHDEDESSETNLLEVQILRLLLQVAPPGCLPDRSVGLITPRSAQRAQLAALARTRPSPANPGAVAPEDADVVERFQGGERPVVLVSACTSSPSDLERNPDFYLQPARLNVTLSRHRRLLVLVVGRRILDHLPPDAELLEQMALYKEMRRLCRRQVGVCHVAHPGGSGRLHRVEVFGVEAARVQQLRQEAAEARSGRVAGRQAD